MYYTDKNRVHIVRVSSTTALNKAATQIRDREVSISCITIKFLSTQQFEKVRLTRI